MTSRYATDPVATQVIDNLLGRLSRPGEGQTVRCACLGESARAFLKPFGLGADTGAADQAGLVVVGEEPLAPGGAASLQAAADRGATVLFLPGAPVAEQFGLQREEQRLFIGRATDSPLLPGLQDGDVYLKAWLTLPVGRSGNGWQEVVAPGIVTGRAVGDGRLIACELDPRRLGDTRARVKAVRLWNTLLTGLGARREGFEAFLTPGLSLYEESEWEAMPPYMNW